MRRRHFLAAFGAASISWRIKARAQAMPARIGFLASGSAASISSAYQIRTIKQGLTNNGLIEGRDYVFEPCFAAGSHERLPEMARDLAQADARVIIVNAVATVRAAQHLNPPVPVVMIGADDPVGNGIVASLEKPGSHVTGPVTENEGLTPRMLEVQRAVLPQATSIALLYNPTNSPASAFLNDLRQRAGALKIAVMPIEFSSRDELETAFAKFATKPPDAVHVMVDAGTDDFIDRIPALALMHRLPTFGSAPEFATFGGLIAYGASQTQLYLRAGHFVKQILDGAKPADLPIETPSRPELWINLRTAKSLNLSVPASLVTTADKVIGG